MRLRPLAFAIFLVGGYGLALVVFGAYDSYPKERTQEIITPASEFPSVRHWLGESGPNLILTVITLTVPQKFIQR